jgi:hypothetical protein
MKDQTWTGEADRSRYQPGPWDNEPDKAQWTDPATGYPCLIVRHHNLGNLCGYVGVPNGHPYYGQHYDNVPDVSVHGGLTFANKCQQTAPVCHIVEEGEDDDVWWFGFDCAHCWDLCPGTRGLLAEAGFPPNERDVYRDWNYVHNEVTELARQLKDRADGPK